MAGVRFCFAGIDCSQLSGSEGTRSVTVADNFQITILPAGDNVVSRLVESAPDSSCPGEGLSRGPGPGFRWRMNADGL